MRLFDSIGIVGAGAWGTALAVAGARAGRQVLLYGRDAAQIEAMRATRRNESHLPGIVLEDSIRPVSALAALEEAKIVILSVPAQTTRQVALVLKPHLARKSPIVISAKGIERGSGAFPSEIVAELLPGHPVAILSGPSFAADVGRGLPTAVVMAATDAGLAQRLATSLSTNAFRVYHSLDPRGVEIGGAAKNVLAIAAGIVEGRQLGESAKAAVVTRGFAEMSRFSAAIGGKIETLMGLSGLGDLVLSCGSTGSRNFSYGLDLGRGMAPADAGAGKLAEGAHTASVLVALSKARRIEMPISTAVAEIIAGTLGVEEAILRLVSRPQRAESGR